jgi:hypothetical protein
VNATRGQLADHAIVTVSVNNQEVVGRALSIVGKAGQVTLAAVGNQNQDWVVANGNLVVAYEKRIQGALYGSCRVLTDGASSASPSRSGPAASKPATCAQPAERLFPATVRNRVSAGGKSRRPAGPAAARLRDGPGPGRTRG